MDVQLPRDVLLHVADLHFWQVEWNPLRMLNKRAMGNLNVLLKRRRYFKMEAADPYIEALRAAGGTDILLTGDFTSTASEAEFAMAKAFVDRLQRSGFSVHLVPGNHDVYTFESVRDHRFARHFGPLLPPAGFPVRRTLAGGTPIILVPTVCPNMLSSKGLIHELEIEKTAELLSRCEDSVIIVAGHYPLLNRTHAYELTRERRLRNADALRKALGESGKRILYVAGHVHRFSHTQDPHYPNLRHLTTGAFFYRNRKESVTGEFSRLDIQDAACCVHRFVHTHEWGSEEVHVSTHA
ncbi:MAG: phosphohydrolase [Candidatus Hydrogenedentota bacterium]